MALLPHVTTTRSSGSTNHWLARFGQPYFPRPRSAPESCGDGGNSLSFTRLRYQGTSSVAQEKKVEKFGPPPNRLHHGFSPERCGGPNTMFIDYVTAMCDRIIRP
jgi:hypothetical protein